MVRHASANVIVMQNVRQGSMRSAQAPVRAAMIRSGTRLVLPISLCIRHAFDVVSLLPWLIISLHTEAI